MNTMSSSDPRQITADERADMRKWLETWREAGRLLDEERWQRIRHLTDDEAWEQTESLFKMWEPGMTGDAGEGLLLQQDVFARARAPRPRR
jgi:hypothetical protein